MAATVREIAKAASVSIGTVSRALRGVPGVSAEHAARVRQIADRMQYRKSLRRSEATRSKDIAGRTLAMILLGTDQSMESLPVTAATLGGVEAAISAGGGTMVLANCPSVDSMPPALLRRQVDGVVLEGTLEGTTLGRADTRLMQALRDLPVVWLYGRPEGCKWGDVIATDNVAIGRIAADYLLGRGHRRLAFLSSMLQHPLVDVRQWSFDARARAAGAAVDVILSQNAARLQLPERATTMEEVDALVDRLLALSPRPSGVFAAFDSLGVLVHRALQRRGIALGKEIELISCNNERPLIANLSPPLVTIDIHSRFIGEKAVELLAWRLGNSEDQRRVTWSVEPHLLLPG